MDFRSSSVRRSPRYPLVSRAVWIPNSRAALNNLTAKRCCIRGSPPLSVNPALPWFSDVDAMIHDPLLTTMRAYIQGLRHDAVWRTFEVTLTTTDSVHVGVKAY